jgi:hypothetical protein
VDNISFGYKSVIAEICDFDWSALSEAELSAAARAYYYFSVQFRENLEVACRLHPDDPQLASLWREECDTDNLSPWPSVAAPHERMNHDEFMRRVLELSLIDPQTKTRIDAAGQQYLARTRSVDERARALSITSYEDGGLENVFTAMLRAMHWETPLLQGFRHFLEKHIGFDGDPDGGHGSMIRHLAPDESVRCLWVEFRDLFVLAVPRLAT